MTTTDNHDKAAIWVQPDNLTPWAANPRENDHAVADVANSIDRFGFASPIIARQTKDGLQVIAGHTRLKAAKRLGLDRVPVRVLDLDEDQAKLLALADNRVAEIATWSDDLGDLLRDMDAEGFDLDGLGWTEQELEALMVPPLFEMDEDADELPEVDEEQPLSKPGEVYELGPHRLMCGDSTDPDQVATLMAGDLAELLHADPPYGMGKESDGVANDNLYREKLDRFQMDWIRVWLQHATDRASLYVWGNAEDLWRLWYRAGLAEFDSLTMRNELVWDKGSVPGMASAHLQSYPPATERCLHLMRGQQFLGSVNEDEYPECYEPLRLHMVAERDKAGWVNKDVNEITGTAMAQHWFSRSQFYPITRKHYEALQAAANGVAFCEDFDHLLGVKFADVLQAGERAKEERYAKLAESRSFFDGSHQAATDVWRFDRVYGEDRYGHATPKNLEMISRICRTSAPDNAWIAEPFGGTGTTLIAAAARGRRCAIMELEPVFCDVIRRRWGQFAQANGHDPGPGALL